MLTIPGKTKIAFSICLWAGCLTTNKPSKFDLVTQPVCHNRIVPVDEGN
jgi:hypothetical protein